jgi:hypothetical protein
MEQHHNHHNCVISNSAIQFSKRSILNMNQSCLSLLNRVCQTLRLPVAAYLEAVVSDCQAACHVDEFELVPRFHWNPNSTETLDVPTTVVIG